VGANKIGGVDDRGIIANTNGIVKIAGGCYLVDANEFGEIGAINLMILRNRAEAMPACTSPEQLASSPRAWRDHSFLVRRF